MTNMLADPVQSRSRSKCMYSGQGAYPLCVKSGSKCIPSVSSLGQSAYPLCVKSRSKCIHTLYVSSPG